MRSRPARWAPLALMACQDPFGADRHDLVADRIAAITGTADEATLSLQAWLISDGRAWADAAPDVSWYAVNPDDPQIDALDGEPDATGAAVTLPRGADVDAWGVVVRFPSGAERRAQLIVPASAAPLDGAAIVTTGLLDLDFDEATEEELAVDARRALVAEPAPDAAVPAGSWARLHLAWADARPAKLDRVRWMSTSRRSTFLELDADTTDWATGELVLDDLEIDEATPLAPGPVTLVALAVSEVGLHRAFAADVWVGDPEPGVRTRGRWLGVTPAVGGAVVQGSLTADDDAPTGLRLDAAAPGPLDAADPWGTTALPCAIPVSGPFDPTWLLDGRCDRASVVGARVAVEVE